MVLDSNIVIYGANNDYPRLDSILDRSDLVVASVTLIEVIGYRRLQPIDEQRVRSLLGRMQIVPLDEQIIQRAIELRQQKRMSLGDAIIAATALVYDLPLVTRNVADYQHIAELEIINPFG